MNVERHKARILRIMKRLQVTEPGLPDAIEQALRRGVSVKVVERALRKRVRETYGIVQRRKSRGFGVWVSIWEAEKGGFDPAGGPYVTFCEDHGSICNHDTLKVALDHAPALEWCEDCQRGRN